MSDIRKTVRQWSDRIRDLLFPPKCVGCGMLLPTRQETDIFCPACGAVFARSVCEAGALPRGNPMRVSLTVYRPDDPDGVTQRVIHCIKHRDDSRVFRFLGAGLAQTVRDALTSLPPESDPPVRILPSDTDVTLCGLPSRLLLCAYPPRKPRSIRVEGVDQAKRLATETARALGIECCPLFVRRQHGGRDQKKLTAAKRQQNAHAAYRLAPARASAALGKWILLVDDVCTTGATLRALTDLALSAGAVGVLWVTVGQTVHRA